LELLAPQSLKDCPEVQGTLSHDRIDVSVGGSTVCNVELEARGQLAETLSGKLLKDSTAILWRQTNLGGHCRRRIT
jgi:hypothetical protein